MKTTCLFVGLLAFALVAGGCSKESSSAGKADFVAQLTGGVKQLLTAHGVKQFSGIASFKDRGTIALGDVASLNEEL